MEGPSRGANGRRGGGGRSRRPWKYMYSRKQGNSKSNEQSTRKEGENAEDVGDNCRGININARRRGRTRNINSSRESEALRDPHSERENENEHNSNENNGDQTKRRKSTTNNIRNHIIKQWETKIPGYLLYNSKSPPKIPDYEEKFNAAFEFLLSNGFSNKSKVVEIEENEYFDVMYELVVQCSTFNKKWLNFSVELHNDPEEVLNIWGLAMYKIVQSVLSEEDGTSNGNCSSDEDKIKSRTDIRRIQAGIMKCEPVTPFSQIKSSLLGKFVTIRGAVVRTGNIHPLCTNMTFFCANCDATFSLDQPGGRFTLPTRCGFSDECGNVNNFDPIVEGDTTKLKDSRRIRIQDMQSCDIERGSVPRTIDCELLSSLVNICTAGNAVTITGIVKMNKEIIHGSEQSLHSLYIEVVAIRNHKDSERTMGGHWFSFSNKDYYLIKEIHDTENLFRLLIASICPSIYGHELVKAGLLLCLFGGTPHDDQLISRRSDINMLMVGDPGIGKSQMLKVVTEISPRGVYVCGTGSTIAGLTVTLVKDGDDYSLEAGALVMADKGCCCIDEFDKMQNQHSALLEAMEQQSISIAKSGVFRTLPARATVIAAANPVGGHYDKTKTLTENIKINAPLMSRFDLIFILLDKPDQEFDKRVVEHVMGVDKSKVCSNQISPNFSNITLVENDLGYKPLMERIKFSPKEKVDLIPHNLLRKYIAYAKQYVKPKLSPEAAAILKEYYLNLRVKSQLIDSTPVTTRQLESLVRLTEARAKVELRELATAEDAKDVLEIFESSLCSAFDDEVVAMSAFSESIIVSSTGSNKSQSKANAKKLVSTLQRYAEQQSQKLFTVEEIRQISSAVGLRTVVDSLITILNNQGFLLKKGGKTYQLQSIDF